MLYFCWNIDDSLVGQLTTSRWTGRGPRWTRTGGTLSRWSSPARTCRRTTRLRGLIRNSALKTTHVMDFLQYIMKFWAIVFDGFHVIYDWISAGCPSHQPESERYWLLQLHCEEPVWWGCFYWMGSGAHCSLSNLHFWIDSRIFQTICPKINSCIKTCANKLYLTCQVVDSLPTPSYLTTTYMAGGVRSAYSFDR